MQDHLESAETLIHTPEDEALAHIAADGGWIGSNALLQRCDLVRNGDQLSVLMSRLVREKKCLRRSGPIGLEYAPLGLPEASPATSGTARGPASVAEQIAPTRDVPLSPPLPRPAPHRAIEARVRRHRDELARVRGGVLRLLEEIPLRPAAEFRKELGASEEILKEVLHQLRYDKVIDVVGGGRGARWRLLAVKAAPDRMDAAIRIKSKANDHWLDVRERLITLFQSSNRWHTERLAREMKRHPNSVLNYCGRLQDEGLLERLGSGAGAYWKWIGPTAKGPAIVVHNPTFAVTSSNELELRCSDGLTAILDPAATQALFRFANSIGTVR